MELLRRHRARLTALWGATLIVGLAGCAFYEALRGGETGLAFSHALHYGEEGLDCIACHPTYDSSDDPGMPVLGQCMLCHEDIDAEKPPEMRIETLFDGEVYRASRFSALPEDIVFSHADHAIDESLCGTCHTGIEENERLDADIAVDMDGCSACHERLGIENECATCHYEIRVDRPPGTHDDQWKGVHGRVFRSGSDRTVDRCSMCHQESSCTSCHMEEQPANHTNYWRRRGHGITARMDRNSCWTCHRSDSCNACHQEVSPLNHNALWGSPQNRHCLSCHITSMDGGCFTCHMGTPSHAMAAPQPASHTPGMNCTQCHGISAPLPHVTKGDDCTICHL